MLIYHQHCIPLIQLLSQMLVPKFTMLSKIKKALFFLFFIIQSTQWQIGLFQNNVFEGRFILKGHYCVQAANNFGHY